MLEINGTTIWLSRGNHQDITINITVSSGELPDTSDDAGLYFTVKRSVNDIVTLIRKKIDADTSTITLYSSDTKKLGAGDYVWDITYYRDDGERIALCKPRKFIIGEVVG